MSYARALLRLGDMDAAQAQLRSAFQQAQSAGLKHLEADCTHNLGVISYYQGDYSEAIAHFAEALALCRDTGNWAGEARALNNLSAIYADQGDYGRANAHCHHALRIRQTMGDRWGEASSLGNLGGFASEQGRYEEARSFHQRALQICREIGDRQVEANEVFNLGHVALHLGDHPEAWSRIEQALSIFRELDDRRGEAWCLTYLALLLHLRDENDAAAAYCRQALPIAQELGDRHVLGWCWTNLGHALGSLSQTSDAKAAYEQALSLRRELHEFNLAQETLAGLAQIALDEDDLPQARVLVDEIVNYLSGHALQGASEPYRVYLTCYRVLTAGRDPRAEDLLQAAHDRLQQQAGAIDDESLRQSFLDSVRIHREIRAICLAQQKKQQGQSQHVRLPRIDALAGRPPREDELVDVYWLPAASSDETIPDKVERRRARLQRLLQAAAAVGARPTIEHLATALCVSRATIKRDLAALRHAGHDMSVQD